MHSKIAQFPNQVMYGGRLKSHESVASHLLRDLPNVTASEGIDKEALETPVVFFDTAGCEFFERADGGGDEGSKCNENEAEVVGRWVEELVRILLRLPLISSQLAMSYRFKPACFRRKSRWLLRTSCNSGTLQPIELSLLQISSTGCPVVSSPQTKLP
jgi:hypothetical protein